MYDIHSKLRKTIASLIIYLRKRLFNTGVLPDSLKFAKIYTVFKSGDV